MATWVHPAWALKSECTEYYPFVLNPDALIDCSRHIVVKADGLEGGVKEYVDYMHGYPLGYCRDHGHHTL